MLGGNMQEALNAQLNAELYSAYLYLSMSAYFESINLRGFGNWMRAQAQEELAHAGRFFDHIVARGGRILLRPVGGPPTEWDSPLAVFEATYQHEQRVTGMINDLVKLAEQETEEATRDFLQWFVSEQVEEEASVDEIVQKIRSIGEEPEGLSRLDVELGRRR